MLAKPADGYGVGAHMWTMGWDGGDRGGELAFCHAGSPHRIPGGDCARRIAYRTVPHRSRGMPAGRSRLGRPGMQAGFCRGENVVRGYLTMNPLAQKSHNSSAEMGFTVASSDPLDCATDITVCMVMAAQRWG